MNYNSLSSYITYIPLIYWNITTLIISLKREGINCT